MPKSIVLTPSRKNVLRPTRPVVLRSVLVKDRNAVLGSDILDVNGCVTLRPNIVGSSKTGRLSLKPSKFRSKAVVVTVNGVPLASFTTAENCQPPKAWPRKPLSPVKNGRRYVPYIVNRCGVWKRESACTSLALFPFWLLSPAPTNVLPMWCRSPCSTCRLPGNSSFCLAAWSTRVASHCSNSMRRSIRRG